MSGVNGPALIDTSQQRCKVFTANLAQAAATYTLAAVNATGGVVILGVDVYCTVAGATFTSASIQTNDTTAVTILSAAEGVVANLTAGKNIAKAFTGPTYLHTSKLIQYTIAGATGTGTLLVVVRYQPTVAGADLS